MKLPASERAVLDVLVTRGEGYGLELVEASNGVLTRGGVYVTLGRMEAKGLVTSAVGDGGRRMYRATGLGERALLAARIFSGEATVVVRS